MNILKNINKLNKDILSCENIKYLEDLYNFITRWLNEISSVNISNLENAINSNVVKHNDIQKIEYDDRTRLDFLCSLKIIKENIFLLKNNIPCYSEIDNKKEIYHEYLTFNNDILTKIQKFIDFYESFSKYLEKILNYYDVFLENKKNQYKIIIKKITNCKNNYDFIDKNGISCYTNYNITEKKIFEEIMNALQNVNYIINYLNIMYEIKKTSISNSHSFFLLLKNNLKKIKRH